MTEEEGEEGREGEGEGGGTTCIHSTVYLQKRCTLFLQHINSQVRPCITNNGSVFREEPSLGYSPGVGK